MTTLWSAKTTTGSFQAMPVIFVSMRVSTYCLFAASVDSSGVFTPLIWRSPIPLLTVSAPEFSATSLMTDLLDSSWKSIEFFVMCDLVTDMFLRVYIHSRKKH